MKSKLLFSLAALALISPTMAVPVKNAKAKKEEAVKAETAVKKEEAPKEEKKAANLGMDRIGEAMQALAAANDPEATQLMTTASQNGGKLNLMPDQATALIQRAIDKNLIPAEGVAKAPSTGDNDYVSRYSEAIQALIGAKDEEALAVLEKAKQNGGKLETTTADMEKFVKRAISKGLIPEKSTGAASGASNKELAAKLIPALAQKGDTKATEMVEKAKANNNQLEMTESDIDDIIKRAKEAGIIPKDDFSTIARAIQGLAEKGDADAKAKIEEAKANGGALSITPADGEKFVTKAREQKIIE